jgi:hypothetical protein
MGIANITNNILTDSGLNTSSFLTTSAAASTYLPLVGGILTGNLNITTASYLTSRLKLTNTISGGNIWAISSGSENVVPSLASQFAISNETTNQVNFILSPSGRLVIGPDLGTTTPNNNFEIFDINPVLGVVDVTSNNARNSSIVLRATNNAGIVSAESYSFALPLILRTSGTDRLTIHGSTGLVTLTGPLNGTSATMSGNSAGGFIGLTIANASTGAAQIALNNSAQSWLVNTRTDNQFSIFNATASTTPFLISTTGNVGIGTASPSEKLEVQNGYLSTYQDANVNDAGYGVQFYTNGGGSKNSLAAITLSQVGTARSGNLLFQTSNGGAPTTKLTISSTGAATFSSSVTAGGVYAPEFFNASGFPFNTLFGSGADATTTTLRAGSTNGFQSAIFLEGGNVSNTIRFNTASTERMRITSGGYTKSSNNNAYVNSTGPFHETNQDLNSGQIAVLRHSGNSSPIGLEIAFTGADPNNASNYMLGAYTTSGGFTWIYRIFSNGTVSARSDARWKKNIETTRSGYIEDLCKLRVVKYNWYNHQDDAPKELGLIAQEVEEVFPNLIQIDPVIAKKEVEQEDGTIIEEEFEDGVSRSIKTSVLPFMLLKAMQEQQAQIQELKTEIDSLKNQIK